MDNVKKCCGFWDMLKHRKSAILGGVLVVLATILTIFNPDGVAVLGLFIAGLCLLKNCYWKSNGCYSSSHCCCCNKEDCCESTVCHTPTELKADAKTTKKTTKK